MREVSAKSDCKIASEEMTNRGQEEIERQRGHPAPMNSSAARRTGRLENHTDQALGLLPSVAQPPLPLHEFLALHPLSLVLQPPCPLHSFCPLHPCLPFASSICWSATPALLLAVEVAAYVRTANDPVRRPATAAPAITALDGLIIL
jgi:hypothetical protein